MIYKIKGHILHELMRFPSSGVLLPREFISGRLVTPVDSSTLLYFCPSLFFCTNAVCSVGVAQMQCLLALKIYSFFHLMESFLNIAAWP